MESNKLVEAFKHILATGMCYSANAHSVIFDKTGDVSNALAYLNAAISRFSAAEALYYASYNILGHSELENIFHQFKVYTDEFFKDIRTDHSYQWIDIEFNKLKDIYDSSTFAIK